MRLKSSLPIVLLTFFLTNLSFGQTDKSLKGIEKDFEKILEVTKAPGFAVAIVKGNKTIYARGFGYRDLENKIQMDENTLLAIGSSTKAFTSGVLGQLRDEGRLSFDDSPIKYVKDLKFYNDELNNGINIRDLMSHQTGIPRHDGSWYLFPTNNKDSLIQRIQFQEPTTGLRQKWYYNNFMFLIQGVIAEKLTGKTWEENVKERFFEPLGMTRSNLSIDELLQNDNIAVGYELYKDSIVRKMEYYHIAGMAPAGSINSSVKEMANWLKLWINNGEFNEKTILPVAYIREAMSSQAVIREALPSVEKPDMFLANYGYGWMISSYKGHYRVEHGGNIDGFSANVAFFPSDSIGIVVLTNQNSSLVPAMVRNTVADRLLNEKKTDWTSDYSEQMKKRKELVAGTEKESNSVQIKNTAPSHELISYEGNYFHPGYGRFYISTNGDSLFANFKLEKWYLKHTHYNIFEPIRITKHGIDTTATTPMWKFNFTTNDEGEIASVRKKIELALDQPIEFKREPKILDLKVAELTIYEGEYERSGTVIKVYAKDDNTLYMLFPEQPESKLLAIGKNLFIVDGLEGYKVKFTDSGNGIISEIVLIQPNGTFKAKKK